MIEEINPYVTNKEFRHKLMEEGIPTLLRINHAGAAVGYANRTSFIFDTSDADLDGDGTTETTPLKGLMFWITGFRVYCPAGTTFGAIILDEISTTKMGRVLINNTYAGAAITNTIMVDGIGQSFAAGTALNAPTIQDIWGVYAVPARASIKIYPAVNAGLGMTAYFIGYRTDRKY